MAGNNLMSAFMNERSEEPITVSNSYLCTTNPELNLYYGRASIIDWT